MLRIDEVRAFDHIVLLVAAEAVLRAECGRHAQIAAFRQGIEAVRQITGDRRRMRD